MHITWAGAPAACVHVQTNTRTRDHNTNATATGTPPSCSSSAPPRARACCSAWRPTRCPTWGPWSLSRTSGTRRWCPLTTSRCGVLAVRPPVGSPRTLAACVCGWRGGCLRLPGWLAGWLALGVTHRHGDRAHRSTRGPPKLTTAPPRAARAATHHALAGAVAGAGPAHEGAVGADRGLPAARGGQHRGPQL
jgi:hypothetical protein